MPYETKRQAEKRAKRLGFPKSSIIKSRKKGYFIAPRGVTTMAGKKAYAECRADSSAKSTCAKIAHSVQKKNKRRRGRK